MSAIAGLPLRPARRPGGLASAFAHAAQAGILILLAGLPLPARAAGADDASAWPETLTGIAEARIVADGSRFTTRLAFAAAVDPPRLRIEVVKAGTLQALAWYDERRVIVLAPGDPPLVHEGPPTREVLEATLGLPFCPAEIFAALRGGLAPPITCGSGAARATEDGIEVATTPGTAGPDDPRRATLRFSHFRRDGGRAFPRRVVLDSDVARATLEIVVLQESPKAPSPPSAALLASARRVGAAELAAALGLAPAPLAPAPIDPGDAEGLGR